MLHVAGAPECVGTADAVAVVGARRATEYGLTVAHDIGRGLSSAGVSVVSGLALGVDAAAHSGALEGPAPPVAVLAGGSDRPYPASKRRLHAAVCAAGAVVSEMPPGFGVHRWAFVARNRLIAALARVVVVVEATERSGSLTTADFGAELGRTVAAVPGRVNCALADGRERPDPRRRGAGARRRRRPRGARRAHRRPVRGRARGPIRSWSPACAGCSRRSAPATPRCRCSPTAGSPRATSWPASASSRRAGSCGAGSEAATNAFPNLIAVSERPVPAVLSIAGSDSGGGAGIQADLKAFARCGVHGMTAIAALTAQNTVAVTGVHQVPGEFIVAQVRAVVEDIGVDAVKIGMLGDADTVRAVREALELLDPGTPVVLDPVMVAESGAVLLDEPARVAIVEELLPRVTVITPNVPEARVLAGDGGRRRRRRRRRRSRGSCTRSGRRRWS